VKYPHIAARIFNTPLLIHPQKLDALIAGLGQRLFGAPLVVEATPGALAEMSPEMFSTRRGERVREAGWPGYTVTEGVAVVPIAGALVHRTKLDANSDLLLGYNDMALATEHAMANADVHAVLQVYDSPGGEVAGAFEFGQRMFDLRGKKPMYAIADHMAASAAYLGASAAQVLAINATGYAGSIGVVLRHVDFSGALAKEGIRVEFVWAGAHKVDGNPFEKLPASVRADLQAEINTLYEMFVGAVARHMGITAEAVRGTEARTYMGQAAVDAGLVHRIATTDQLITELAGLRARTYPAGSARSSTASQKGHSMSGTTPAADAQQPANQPAALTQADVDRAAQAATTTERARVSGILTHAEAAGRTALAHQCVASGLSVQDAGALMAAAPKAAAAGQPFAAAMAGLGNPDVKGIEAEQAADDANPKAIAASWDKAFGVGKGK
jgi:capsid assembly protease